MRFERTVPGPHIVVNPSSGDNTQNLKNAVSALAPNQGGTIEFTPGNYDFTTQAAVDFGAGNTPMLVRVIAYGAVFRSSITDAFMFYDSGIGQISMSWFGGIFKPKASGDTTTGIGLSFGQDASYNSRYFASNSRFMDISSIRNGGTGGYRFAFVGRIGNQGVGFIDNCSGYANTGDASSIGGVIAGPGVANRVLNFQAVGSLGIQLGNNTGGAVAGIPNSTPMSTSQISATVNNLTKGVLLSMANRNSIWLDLESNTTGLDMGSGNSGNMIWAYFTGNTTNYTGTIANNQILNTTLTQGQIIPTIYGQDNRGGLTTADGATTGLFTTDAASIGLYRATITALATAYTSGSPVYTLTWTQNGLAKTISVTIGAANSLQTATALCNPDTGTQVTVQLTGSFTATVRVGAALERLV